ncbi:LPXTG-site transpeptidase family protein [Bacillus anthracis]|uniref:LPXTG-site transpeptidase family protein n=3 Tax=Bacillus cereus group TaxID=86661 RepID=A0A2P0HKG9_BACAN|nr:class D sortase [Bacillus anthracis]AAP28746.1 LPXTG-site transpeptidase family protein [Bacillus anthracis str. Ames]AAT34193.2 LPXTG-site transpeptidase family protein [Bacillus anthracis str. 'Ames Ancestor']AFH86226.1 LPXTG-site transpeptidase family protein [Bacillus anthracis str. H9401]AHK40990.1 LPXTG-site transpeptidase family protein [Bacillus anthracis str. SVA11]AIM08731.1 LPXTG-site transpeptidase family protein [Bacillus anthracis]
MILMAIGLLMGSYYAVEWYKGKSSAQELTNEEIKSFKNIQHNQLPYETLVTSQVPSSQTEHKEGEKVAMLNIPKLKKKFSIYWGADDATLKKGVGMFVSDVTTTPSGGGHTVLSGHRDTVFTDLGQLKEKDTLVLEYDNKTYTYEIQKIWITHADDRTVIIKKEEPILTLTTCYPFDYIGDAPDRYIIEAKLTGSYSK